MTDLVVEGARVHNLVGVDVRIPRDRLTVITGPSGSGKSSLAFDTIYAEGQRRYVESLSAHARRFLERLDKPDVDRIDGLSPAIAVRPAGVSRNPRSTVGTSTEIYDRLRLLWARAGQVHCPVDGRPLEALTVSEMVDRVLAWPAGTRFSVHAPVARDETGDFSEGLDALRRDGFARVVVDGATCDLADLSALPVGPAHDVDVQIDRLAIRDGVRPRLAESLELALRVGGGEVHLVPRDGEPVVLTDTYRCPDHGPVLDALTPRTFSFNSPEGACPRCRGLGEERVFDPALIVPDASLGIADGAIAAWGKPGAALHKARMKLLKKHLPKLAKKQWRNFTEDERAAVLHGEPDRFAGVIPLLEARAKTIADKKGATEDELFETLAEEIGRFQVTRPCSACGGSRLRAEARAVTVGGRSLPEVAAMSVEDARAFFDRLSLDGMRAEIGARLIAEIASRLRVLDDVGLSYLSLDRTTGTLSAGEAQRVRLATRIGSALIGVLYVLDEPSIGLHARDTERLLSTLVALRDAGSTVLVVEHDPQIIRAADHVVDMGPGAGRLGGRVVASGTPTALAQNEASLTGRYLAGRPDEAVIRRREPSGTLTVEGATTHNLNGVTVDVPLGVLSCVTGVSGSGKSSLIVETLLPRLRAVLAGGEAEGLRGAEQLDKVVAVDQAPIGRSPRSTPASYVGLFPLLRELFASLPEARARGYKAARFSFNVKGGRCETCKGDGMLRVSMEFLPDVYVTCQTCGGSRYDRETLEVRYRGSSIADVLAMTVDEAAERFEVLPKIAERLRALRAVGLGYLRLGQSATTISGGEAQRLKLARELTRPDTGRTLYVLDEPTTGLHPSDVDVLLHALEALVERGNTVVLIEHDLDVIAQADHVIDLGPDGGPGGGRVVVVGSPDTVAAHPESITGRYLKRAAEARA